MDIFEKYKEFIYEKIDARKEVFAQFREQRRELVWVDLDKGTKVAYQIADWLDWISAAFKIHQARKSWWERVGSRILKALEAVLLIAGAFAKKSLPI